jgi:radical SAM protein with 4Fe4S-binding SPASM domain
VGQFASKVSRKLNTPYAFGYPHEVQLVPTNACNIHCSQCPKTWYETDNRHLDVNVYERVRDQLFPHIKILHLQGLGEPMISPLFSRIVEDAARHNVKVNFVTNASVLKQPMARRLAEIGAGVTISLDGGTAPTHERLRRGSNFERVMQVFQWLSDAGAEFAGSGFSLNVNTVVTTMNVHELDAILEICRKHRVGHWALMNPGVGDRTDEFAQAAIGSHPEELGVRLPALLARAAEYGVYVSYPSFIQLGQASAEPVPGEVLPLPAGAPAFEPNGRLFPGKCADPWQRVYIDVDGWIRPCCRALWIGMGNILEEDFLDIWNNEHFMRLRRTVNSNCPPSFCRDCPASYGINNGDEQHAKRLEERGIQLRPAPRIGVAGLLD